MEPNPKQALALWRMLTADKPEIAEPKLSDVKPKLTPAERAPLVDAGYLKEDKRNRATHLVLDEKAWDWAARADSVSVLKSRSPVGAEVLEALLNRLLPNLRTQGVALAEILRPISATRVAPPKPSATNDVPALGTEVVNERNAEVLAAVRSLAAHSKTGAVRLAQLRAKLSSRARAEVDAALRTLRDQHALVLFQDDDRASLTEMDHEAALVDANTPHHLVYLEKR